MKELYYIGFDVHKRIIAYCIKRADGAIVKEGKLTSKRQTLKDWAATLDHPWSGAMEATMFTGWVYDTLLPYAQELQVANPLMLRAIAASKKKNDALDASKIADALRANLLPACYMGGAQMRELRRELRYRNFLVRMAIDFKNKTAGLLMECGAEYSKKRLHGKKYFAELLGSVADVPESVKEMLRFNRVAFDLLQQCQRRLVRGLRDDPRLAARVALLMTIPGVGEILALTWALEVDDPHRFRSIRRAVSYCGICSALRSSAGKTQRGPLSKQRNKHLQRMLVEAAKLAPRWNPQLAAVHKRELARGNRNRATLAVARKLVSYLLAVDKSGRAFQTGVEQRPAA